MKPLRRIFRFVLALLAVVSCAPRAFAEGCEPDSPSRAASLAPDIADLVIVIDHAADVAASTQGRATIRVLQEFGLFAGTAIAWNELASSMGLTPADAVRAVAGERTMLVIRSESVERPSQWALISFVEPRTERLVRERLKPVPKRIVDGQPVLMLENGRFLMATRSTKEGKEARANAALLVAPADASALFDACLPLLAGKRVHAPIDTDPMASRACAELPGERAPDLFIMYRPRTSDEPDAPRTLLTIAGARSPDSNDQWNARIACSPNALGEVDRVVASGISEPFFRAAAERAIVAFAAPVSSRRDGGSGFSRILFRFMSDLGPLFDGAGLVSLRERATDVDNAGLEIIVGTALARDAGIASKFDSGMATLLNRIARDESGLTDAHDFEGRFPAAVREADLSTRALSLAAPLIGPAPVARWCFAGSCDAGLPAWWIAQIASTSTGSDGSALRAVASALTPDPDAPVAKRLATIGIVRPDALYRVLPPMLRSLTPALAPFRWVSRIEWEAAAHADGLVRGHASLQFRPEAVGDAATLPSVNSR